MCVCVSVCNGVHICAAKLIYVSEEVSEHYAPMCSVCVSSGGEGVIAGAL